MVGHVNLCLDEIEAEIAATDFSIVGARAREMIAQHIAGIRYIVEAAAVSGSRADLQAASRIAAAVAARDLPIALPNAA